MRFLSDKHRAPAETPKEPRVSALNWLLSRTADLFFPCRHHRITLPYNDRQHCLDCGASRLYFFQSDFEHSDAGIQVGPWKRPTRPVQDARRVAASHLVDNALAARPRSSTPPPAPRNGREAILQPGADNPLFQPRRRACHTTLERVEACTTRVMERHGVAEQEVSQ